MPSDELKNLLSAAEQVYSDHLNTVGGKFADNYLEHWQKLKTAIDAVKKQNKGE